MIVAFDRAAREGDVAELLSLLHPDVVFTTDGGGLVDRRAQAGRGRGSGRAHGQGAGREGRRGTSTSTIVDVNGMPGLRGTGLDGVAMVMSFTVDDGQIVAIDVQRNPEKLRRLP